MRKKKTGVASDKSQWKVGNSKVGSEWGFGNNSGSLDSHSSIRRGVEGAKNNMVVKQVPVVARVEAKGALPEPRNPQTAESTTTGIKLVTLEKNGHIPVKTAGPRHWLESLSERLEECKAVDRNFERGKSTNRDYQEWAANNKKEKAMRGQHKASFVNNRQGKQP